MNLRPKGKSIMKKKKKEEQEQTKYLSEQEETHSIWSLSMLSTQYNPKKLLGRVLQKQQIHKFIKSCIVNQINNRVLYISGIPGIGKTVTTKQIIADFQKEIDPKKILFFTINALQLKNAKDIYKNIVLNMKSKIQSKNTKPDMLALQIDNYLKITSKKYFFLIDQIDFLYTKDQSILYNLFEWSYNPKGNFSLIVIANTMDFPQRLSSKVMSRMGNLRLVFKPYSYIQIKQIVLDRLRGSNLFQATAIDYSAKKLASYTSDIRKIFNVLKQAVIKKISNKKIKVADIQKIWNQLSIQNNQVWRKQLPQIYLNVIQAIKIEGGKSHSGKIYKEVKVKHPQISCIELQIILQELNQMGILKVNEKNQNGYIGFNAILLKL